MGYDLYSQNTSDDVHEDKKYYRFNIGTWNPVLTFAQYHGWKPAGTDLYPDDEDPEVPDAGWDRGYFSNDGAVVSEEDARNIGEAVEEGIRRWREYVKGAEDNGQMLLEYVADSFSNQAYKGSVYEILELRGDKEWEDYIEEFATFCKLGAFGIH